MKWLRDIFRRKEKQEPEPLRISRIADAPMTPAADDAEIAAQALLESRIYGDKQQRKAARRRGEKTSHEGKDGKNGDVPHDTEFYHQLSDRIKEGYATEARNAMRYVAYCEEELKHQPSDIATLEHGLFKHQDTVEREGGELLKRWQKCLAECVVRQMGSDEKENGK